MVMMIFSFAQYFGLASMTSKMILGLYKDATISPVSGW